MPNPPPGWPTDRPRAAPPATALSSCVIVLVRTQGPINLGMVARLCGNLGAAGLRLVAPECPVDCEDSRKFATHGRDLLLSAPVFADLRAATADCEWVVGTSGDFRIQELGEPLRPQELPARLAARGAARWALVFGNEADGLDAAELRACQAWVHLDTFGPLTSYNLANSVAICAYVVAMQGAAPPAPPDPAAPRAQVENLADAWVEGLQRSGYFAGRDRVMLERAVRKLVDRLPLTATDANHLRAHWAQVVRALPPACRPDPPV